MKYITIKDENVISDEDYLKQTIDNYKYYEFVKDKDGVIRHHSHYACPFRIEIEKGQKRRKIFLMFVGKDVIFSAIRFDLDKSGNENSYRIRKDIPEEYLEESYVKEAVINYFMYCCDKGTSTENPYPNCPSISATHDEVKDSILYWFSSGNIKEAESIEDAASIVAGKPKSLWARGPWPPYRLPNSEYEKRNNEK